jgi:hypothetical protein
MRAAFAPAREQGFGPPGQPGGLSKTVGVREDLIFSSNLWLMSYADGAPDSRILFFLIEGVKRLRMKPATG